MAAIPEGPWLTAREALAPAGASADPTSLPLPKACRCAIDAFERQHVERASQAAVAMPAAARLAGISHSMLARLVRRHRAGVD